VNNDVVGKIQGENSKINLIASAIGALVPRRFRLARKPANRAYAEIIGWPLSSHAKPLIPGAGTSCIQPRRLIRGVGMPSAHT